MLWQCFVSPSTRRITRHTTRATLLRQCRVACSTTGCRYLGGPDPRYRPLLRLLRPSATGQHFLTAVMPPDTRLCLPRTPHSYRWTPATPEIISSLKGFPLPICRPQRPLLPELFWSLSLLRFSARSHNSRCLGSERFSMWDGYTLFCELPIFLRFVVF